MKGSGRIEPWPSHYVRVSLLVTPSKVMSD